MEVRARQTLADHLNRKHQSSQRETEDLAREKGGLQARVLVQQSQVPPAGGQSSQGVSSPFRKFGVLFSGILTYSSSRGDQGRFK